MKKEFCTYEQALALKELGFDEPCLASYFVFGDNKARNGKYGQTEPELFTADMNLDDRCEELHMHPYHVMRVPLYQQAFRWFREKYGWVTEIHGSLMQNHFYANLLYQAKGEVNNIKMCDTYEEAEQACLDMLIEICKNKQD